MKKNTKNILKMIIITLFLLIMCIIVIPYSINKLLYLPIETNSTNDSDWLSFWGSFLGGIIGSIGALGGVLLTLRKMEKDNRKEEEKKYPFLIPLEKSLLIEKYLGKSGMELKNMDGDVNLINFPNVNILNVGKEHALNCTVCWYKPKKEEVEKYLLENNIEFSEEEINGICREITKNFNEQKYQIVRGEGSDETISYTILSDIDILIRSLVYRQLNKIKGFEVDCDTLPLGKMNIECKNVYGVSVKREYDITMHVSYSGKAKDKNMDNYYAVLSFKLVE